MEKPGKNGSDNRYYNHKSVQLIIAITTAHKISKSAAHSYIHLFIFSLH